MITSPYNFVPLSEKVVMPFWAKHISHDIPFKDAQSGTLKLKIKAESPIFVRNGVGRSVEVQSPERNIFNQFNQQYFIPGSSVKGMLRSVVEIISFGRMKNKVNPHKYSVRDFQNPTNKGGIYPLTTLSNQVECGWLYVKNGAYFLDECGKPGRITHKNLDKLCDPNNKISTYYKNAQNVRTDKDKSSKSKNDNFKFDGFHKFTVDFEDSVGKIIYKIDQEGRTGTIVMTGQSSVRKESENDKSFGKHLEFIFWKTDPTHTEVDNEVIDNFFFAYYDHDKVSQKEDWKWRKSQLDKGEKIPVFFRKENGKIKDMGLTMLYKITYENSIIDSVNQQQKNSDAYDLAEAIFGYVDGRKALKGRVHVGHAFAIGSPKELKEVNAVLAGPKASYYPNYIEQKYNANGKVSKYSTFMDSSAQIRGWKRYPVRNGSTTIINEGTENVSSKFRPLPAGTEFELDVHYHNLRKEELGALISAITFHNTEGLFHSIGSAKPLGYGKISIELAGIDDSTKLEMLKAFEIFMDYSLGHSTPLWFQLPQMKELLAMAKPADDNNLKYMGLTDFANRKKERYALKSYSAISGNNISAKPLSSEKELRTVIEIYNQERRIYEASTDIVELKEKVVDEIKNRITNELEVLKQKLITQLKDRKKQIFEIEKAQKEQREAEEREAKRKEQQLTAQTQGISFEDVDFNTTYKKVEDAIGKKIIRYALQIHNCKEKELEKFEPYFTNSRDIDVIKGAIDKLYLNLPDSEKSEKNMVHRLKRWSKWIGPDHIQINM